MDTGLAGAPTVLAPDPVEEGWLPGDGGATIPGTYRRFPGREGGLHPILWLQQWSLFTPFCFVVISRPAFGGRTCVGEDLQAKMCNTQVGGPPSWDGG